MKNPSSPYALASAARLSLLTTALTLSVQAAPLTWRSAGPTNDWSTVAGNENWTPGNVVWTQNSDAIFDLSSGSPEAANVATSIIVNDITFAASGFSIGAGAGSLVLANDLSSTITVTNLTDTASIAETIGNNTSTPSSLTKAGLGTLTLNAAAANTYSGTTTISAGTLIANHEGSLGVGPVVNNATLNVSKANVTFSGLANALSGAGTVNVTALGTGGNTVGLNGDYSGFTGTWNIGNGAAAGAGKVQMNGKDNAAASINVAANASLLVSGNTHNATVTLGGGDTGESLGQLRVDLVGTNWAGPIILAGDMTGAGDGIIGTNSGPAMISGNISETGGSRTLSKAGGGTLILTGNSTYTGPTRSFSGNISVPAIHNTGVSGPLGTNGLIALGSGGAASTLIYTGSGETTDRSIDLAGTTGNAGINHAGTGLLKFTGNFTTSGAGSKSLVLTVSPTGSGEISGQIVNNSPTNITSLTKNNGVGAWTLSGNNTFTGNVNVSTGDLVITNSSSLGVGPKTITLVTAPNPGGLSSLVLDGSSGDISLPGNMAFTTSFDALSVPFSVPIPGEAAIINSAGNNTIAGNITATSGGGGTALLSNAGNLTLTGTLANNATSRGFHFRGASTGIVTGPITNGSNPVTVLKDAGSGTWTLAGINTYSGSTTITEGTLRLDYTTNDSTKLSDSSALILNGGTLDLAGGTHTEVVASTTLAAGKTSSITRSSGSAKIQLRTVTPGPGSSLVLGAPGIAETDTFNTNGILPWARVVVGGQSVLATNSTDAVDGPITAYAGAYSDVTRLGPSSIPNSAGSIVRIVDGGTSGNISLAASPLTQIGFLQMGASAGPATIAPANDTDVLTVGDDLGGYLWQTPTAGSLTIGSTPNQGVLTAGDFENSSPATLTLTNDSAVNPLTVNSIIADNGTDVISLATGGNNIVLNGDNLFTGSINAGAGLLTLTGDNTFDGALTVNNGATVVLSGDNSGRPVNVSNRSVVNGNGVLQLQANAGNTVSSVSTALSAERTALQPLFLGVGSILQLRSETSVTFAGGNDLGGMGTGNATFDVNNLGSGSGNTLTIAPAGFNVSTTTINVTGGNGYSLATGTINNVGAGATLTLNPTTANHVLGGYTANATLSTTLALGGTAAGNQVTGAILNPATSGATAVNKSGPSTWLLSGSNTYTGNTTISDGTLKAGSTGAFLFSAALNMSGTGTLDLNGFDASFTNAGGGATTATITDSSAVAGVSTLSIPALGNTTIATRILNGPTRAVRVIVRNNNSTANLFPIDSPNTFSGGLVLGHNAVGGTRLRISAPPVTVGSAGAIVSSPFGTGPITIGETAADRAGILLDSLSGFTIANAIVFNTALGNDQPGFRLDTTGHTLSGTITANLSNALFTNTGAARLTGQVTGPNGLQLNNSTVAITLANQTANPNDYVGDTTIGTGAFLILGAADQIPNGALKGSVANNGTLNVGGFSETINGLSGAGVITSTGGGTLSVGDTNASATYTGSTAGTLNLTKIGSGFQTISGAIGHQGDTTVTQGSLALNLASTFADGADVRLNTGGTLILTTAGTDVIDQLFINGAPQAVGKWGRPGSIAALGANFETSLISGDGLLNVTTSGTTPYGTWISTFFGSETNPAIVGQTADPDKDGVDNVTEFAFAGNPNSGSENGKIYVFTVDSDFDGDTDKELILTAAIRTGAAAFGNGAPSTAASVADGITYSIQGSTTLTSFPVTVNAVPTPITTDLPPAGTGYSYRSFSLGGSNGLTPGKGFLRATVTAP
ncbi:autotransporter-associated beta strand repeat-containing protein [Luteolibacter arcticus]|uniref:Autotransporter-associated beta strand repeat-containing protein n=1 Tax=Luteolibacter arcticus TaxID=1581411 RepID=A0ABT3GEG2_9BACT|nr:autotransporter-associated beta strand repeat-containing protein [Luteolibacter arcticus]MCW1922005.1 autotransporter-associated beta strand repeat-containing protein [Luteolibacter arcticus]